MYETTNVTSKTDDYWKKAIGFYDSLTDENKDILIEQTILLDSIDTEGELQDSFLEFIEERDSNS